MSRAGLFLFDCIISEGVVNRLNCEYNRQLFLVSCSLSVFSILLKRRLGDICCCISAFLFFSTSWQAFRFCHDCFHSQMLANNWSTFHSHFHCSHTVTPCACFFFFSGGGKGFSDYFFIIKTIFEPAALRVSFVLIISFVVGNKDTCSIC